MKHHFGDMIDREGGHWTTLPNVERYSFSISDVIAGSKDVTIVTVGKNDESWERIFTLPNLKEVTFHEPTSRQLESIGELGTIERLRITHARPKSIDFIRRSKKVEELVLEYVSGFEDLSPLRDLPKLRALHLENLRRVSDFSGLSGVSNLRYLAIYGTLDWKQPVRDFGFLGGLPALEYLGLWQFITKQPYPAMIPIRKLSRLQKLNLHGSYLDTAEYALIEECLQGRGVKGATWGPYRKTAYRQIPLPGSDVRSRLSDENLRARHPEVLIRYDGGREIDDPESAWFEFTGKGAGRAKCDHPSTARKCHEMEREYEASKLKARQSIDEIQDD